MPKKIEKPPTRKRTCYLCENNLKALDYRDAFVLRRFVTLQGKIRPPRKTGACTRHQRVVARAVKRARVMAILPVKRV
ncbi:MAG: 30S ribosomal protein S18 [Candidatus Moranbacteria bacterium]|nr:30S ribosomal protein S18 [Candidatus Moranbacteria bacterium]